MSEFEKVETTYMLSFDWLKNSMNINGFLRYLKEQIERIQIPDGKKIHCEYRGRLKMAKMIMFDWDKFKKALDKINDRLHVINKDQNIGIVKNGNLVGLILWDYNQGEGIIEGKIQENTGDNNKDGETRKTEENKNSEGSV